MCTTFMCWLNGSSFQSHGRLYCTYIDTVFNLLLNGIGMFLFNRDSLLVFTINEKALIMHCMMNNSPGKIMNRWIEKERKLVRKRKRE